MSAVGVQYLIDTAAIRFGDTRKIRVVPDEWLSHYNTAMRETCARVNLLEFRGLFSLDATALYAYPEEATVITSIEVTDTPSDGDSYRVLGEKFQDEFRSMTTGRYPTADLPEFYFAKANWFYLIPRPTANIIQGGRVTYFGLSDQVTDPSSSFLQTRAVTQDYIIERMLIEALISKNRLVESAARLKLWYDQLDGLSDKFEDPSDDRRSGLRPTLNPFAGHR